MAHRVARRIERLEFDRAPHPDHVARRKPAVDPGDLVLGVGVGEELRARRGDHRVVAAYMVAVLVGIEHEADVPALRSCAGEALSVVERVDGERLTSLRTGDEIVEVAVGVRGPDLLDDLGFSPLLFVPWCSLSRGGPM